MTFCQQAFVRGSKEAAQRFKLADGLVNAPPTVLPPGDAAPLAADVETPQPPPEAPPFPMEDEKTMLDRLAEKTQQGHVGPLAVLMAALGQ